MIIIITDACFLIDLIDIDLFEEFIGLGYQVHITSSVFAELEGDEYVKPVAKCIRRKKIFLYKLTAADQAALEKLMRKHSSRLSEPDYGRLLEHVYTHGTLQGIKDPESVAGHHYLSFPCIEPMPCLPTTSPVSD